VASEVVGKQIAEGQTEKVYLVWWMHKGACLFCKAPTPSSLLRPLPARTSPIISSTLFIIASALDLLDGGGSIGDVHLRT
jgi:hypothetical protein